MSNQQSALSTEQSAMSHQPDAALLAPRPSSLKPQASSLSQSGFTLVELLVTVSIIAILASVLLGALYVAQDQARAQKTRSTIVKLNNILMDRWESYKTRRVPITFDEEASKYPPLAAMCRLTALRELMRLELPDRGGEIPPPATTSSSFTCTWTEPLPPNTTHSETFVVPRSSQSYSYGRGWAATAASDSTKGAILHGAESLYLIVTRSTNDDETGVEMFGESEIGDSDEDGRPEFKDGWGNPISFVRWPAGFVSELQPGTVTPNAMDPEAPTITRDTSANHDPFDPRRVHADAFGLYPLIFSAGPDGKYEIRNAASFNYPNNANGILNPYAPSTGGPPPKFIGGWEDADSDGVNDSIDNIHNHLIGTR